LLSLVDRFELLGQDIIATPMRISPYHDLPFAILRYEPQDEYSMRQEARKLARKLEMEGKEVCTISMSDILWHCLEDCEGHEEIFALERRRNFSIAQEQVTTYLSNPEWRLLPDALAERLNILDEHRNVAFLMRVAAMAPAIYHMSKLLDEMHHRTQVPTILFYPGTLEGATGLRFMGLPEHEALGNYRVKIY
jgi:Domain of unknown function (DUF1788)